MLPLAKELHSTLLSQLKAVINSFNDALLQKHLGPKTTSTNDNLSHIRMKTKEADISLLVYEIATSALSDLIDYTVESFRDYGDKKYELVVEADSLIEAQSRLPALPYEIIGMISSFAEEEMESFANSLPKEHSLRKLILFRPTSTSVEISPTFSFYPSHARDLLLNSPSTTDTPSVDIDQLRIELAEDKPQQIDPDTLRALSTVLGMPRSLAISYAVRSFPIGAKWLHRDEDGHSLFHDWLKLETANGGTRIEEASAPLQLIPILTDSGLFVNVVTLIINLHPQSDIYTPIIPSEWLSPVSQLPKLSHLTLRPATGSMIYAEASGDPVVFRALRSLKLQKLTTDIALLIVRDSLRAPDLRNLSIQFDAGTDVDAYEPISTLETLDTCFPLLSSIHLTCEMHFEVVQYNPLPKSFDEKGRFIFHNLSEKFHGLFSNLTTIGLYNVPLNCVCWKWLREIAFDRLNNRAHSPIARVQYGPSDFGWEEDVEAQIRSMERDPTCHLKSLQLVVPEVIISSRFQWWEWEPNELEELEYYPSYSTA